VIGNVVNAGWPVRVGLVAGVEELSLSPASGRRMKVV